MMQKHHPGWDQRDIVIQLGDLFRKFQGFLEVAQREKDQEREMINQ